MNVITAPTPPPSWTPRGSISPKPDILAISKPSTASSTQVKTRNHFVMRLPQQSLPCLQPPCLCPQSLPVTSLQRRGGHNGLLSKALPPSFLRTQSGCSNEIKNLTLLLSLGFYYASISTPTSPEEQCWLITLLRSTWRYPSTIDELEERKGGPGGPRKVPQDLWSKNAQILRFLS